MEPMSLSELAGDLPRPGVLCTLAKVVGSAPQAPGAKMYVWGDGFKGTIGGGRFEAEVLLEARRLLASDRPETFSGPTKPGAAQAGGNGTRALCASNR